MGTPDERPLRCPACGVRLVARRVSSADRTDDLTVDRCPACHGWWFDGGELERALDVAAKDLAVADDAEKSERLCPVDGGPMWRFDYPQTWAQVDMCRRCRGVWLDARELDEVRTVRRHLRRKAELDPYAPIPGVRGRLIRFIDAFLRGAGLVD